MSILNLFKRAPDIKHLGMLQKRKPAAAAKDAAEAGAKPAKQRKDTTKAAAAAHKAEQASEEPATKRRSAGRVAVAKQEPAEGTKKPAKERKAASKAGAAAQSGVAAAELDTMKPSASASLTCITRAFVVCWIRNVFLLEHVAAGCHAMTWIDC